MGRGGGGATYVATKCDNLHYFAVTSKTVTDSSAHSFLYMKISVWEWAMDWTFQGSIPGRSKIFFLYFRTSIRALRLTHSSI
jgi:hypothetical protein